MSYGRVRPLAIAVIRRGGELLVFEGRPADTSLYERDRWQAAPEGVAPFPVCWLPLDRVARGDAILYPDGLLGLLDSPAS